MAGSFDDARDHAVEAIVSARRCGSGVTEALALRNFGLLERSRCRWSSA